MKETLKGFFVYKSERKSFYQIGTPAASCGVVGLIERLTKGECTYSVTEHGKKSTPISEYTYIAGCPIQVIVEIIRTCKKAGYKDCTSGGGSRLPKNAFTYLISTEPTERFFSIMITTKNGKKVVIANADNYVRNAADKPAAAWEEIQRIWTKYPDPPMTITSLAEREYNDWLKRAGVAFDFRDERRIDVPLYDCTLSEYAENAYFGGWCYCAAMPGAGVGDGIRLDVHSLYPSIMVQGVPADRYARFIDDYWTFDTLSRTPNTGYLIHFSCKFFIKSEAFPFINYRNGCLIAHNADKSAVEVNGRVYNTDVELYMMQPEYEAFRKCYDVKDFKFYDAVLFPLVTDAAPYVRAMYAEKQAAKRAGSVEYTVSKMMLNNLSGGFARRGTATNALFDDDMNAGEFVNVIKKPSHMLIGAWITACGRARLATLAARFHDRFLYCDTDSLHLSGHDIPTDIDIGDNLGQFAIEAKFDHAVYWGQKKYAEWNKEDSKLVLAGLPSVVTAAIEASMTGWTPADIPVSWRMLYGDIAQKICAGAKRIEIPYKVAGSGWRLYRPAQKRVARITDDNREAYYMVERAREESKVLLNDDFWAQGAGWYAEKK